MGHDPIDEVILEIGDTINTLGSLRVEAANRGKGYIAFQVSSKDDETWRSMVEHLVVHSSGFRQHICYRPFKERGPNSNRVAWYWYLQFAADDMEKASSRIINALLRARVQAAQSITSRPPPPRPIPAEHMEAPVSHDVDDRPQRRPRRRQRGTLPESAVHKRPKVRETRRGRSVEKEVNLPWPTNPEQRTRGGRGARPILDD